MLRWGWAFIVLVGCSGAGSPVAAVLQDPNVPGPDAGAPVASPDGPDAGTPQDSAPADDASPNTCGCGLGITCETKLHGSTCELPASVPVVDEGGPKLSSIEVWTVVWRGDEALAASVDAFNGQTLASTYWAQIGAEYGVGAGSAKGVILLEGPPTSVNDAFYDTTIAQLAGKTTTMGTAFGPPNDGTVITFLMPKNVKEPVGTSYHSETDATFTSANGTAITLPYIVLRQDSAGFVSDWDYMTWTESHELIETATDPHPYNAVAVSAPSMDVEGEVADLCNDIPTTQTYAGHTYMLTRAYSGQIAASRQDDPCVPGLGVPYANVALEPLDVKIPKGVGQAGTVHLRAFAESGAAPMHWALYTDDGFAVSPDQGTIAPGQSVAVTITRTKGSPSWPTALNVWVTDPAKPDADIPLQEAFGAVSQP